MFRSLLSYTVAKGCASPRNSTWFTRPFLLVRGWGLGTRLGTGDCTPRWWLNKIMWWRREVWSSVIVVVTTPIVCIITYFQFKGQNYYSTRRYWEHYQNRRCMHVYVGKYISPFTKIVVIQATMSLYTNMAAVLVWRWWHHMTKTYTIHVFSVHTFILLNFSSVFLSDLSTSLSSASYFSRIRLWSKPWEGQPELS